MSKKEDEGKGRNKEKWKVCWIYRVRFCLYCAQAPTTKHYSRAAISAVLELNKEDEKPLFAKTIDRLDCAGRKVTAEERMQQWFYSFFVHRYYVLAATPRQCHADDHDQAAIIVQDQRESYELSLIFSTQSTHLVPHLAYTSKPKLHNIIKEKRENKLEFCGCCSSSGSHARELFFVFAWKPDDFVVMRLFPPLLQMLLLIPAVRTQVAACNSDGGKICTWLLVWWRRSWL